MNRDQYITVTEFAILVQSLASDAMGEATFASEAFGSVHVRAVTLDEIRTAAKNLKGSEAARFDALLALRSAFESNDQLAMGRARERMEGVYRVSASEAPTTADSTVDGELGVLLAPWINLSPEEAVQYVCGMRPGPKAEKDLRRLFSYEVSQAISSLFRAQVVLWWFEGAFRPSIYCPDVKTALYAHTFLLAPGGGVGFRICPYDGEQFFQDRPNQDYCCPAHREAYRVARFRDKQKRNAVKKGKEGKRHGAHKTR